ncbi:MAG: hypothetical protein E7611_09170, partial [Ruminococcaceae bacterium]|nr:hypothetical protein [Oscillospiraceae bacterium]
DGIDGAPGKDGADGADGLTPYIGENGNWWIGDKDTGIKAAGEDGKDGADGEDGKDGIDGAPGKDGADGADGLTPYIGENGNWWIGDEDTGIKAAGEDGKDGADGNDGVDGEDGKDGADGAPGKDGADGLTPYIGANGNWWIGDKDTGVNAEGIKGEQGDKGEQGVSVSKVDVDEQGRLVITLTDGTVLAPIVLPERVEDVHVFGEWIDFNKNPNLNCEDRLFYRICSNCKKIEWKSGEYKNHSFSVVTIDPTCVEMGYDEKTCSRCGIVERENYTDIIEHKWKNEYSYDDLRHWYDCEGCDLINSSGMHEVDETGYCSVCGQFVASSEGVVYAMSDDGTYAKVTDYKGSAVWVSIDEEYNGVPVTHIDDWAFAHLSSIEIVVIPDGVTVIGDYGFYNNPYLKSIAIPDSLIDIGDEAFSQCDSLKKVVFGVDSRLQHIGDRAFRYDRMLRDFIIPEKVTSIGEFAFERSGISNISIPANTTSIGIGAFADCWALIQISVEDGNSAYKSVSGVLYTENGVTLVQYPTGKADSYFDIPTTTAIVGPYAFYGNRNLNTVYINCVESIQEYAFGYCEHITYISPGYGDLIEIADNAFFNCMSLSEFNITDGVTSIGTSAFEGCICLKEIYVYSGNTSYQSQSGVLYSYDGLTLIKYPRGKVDTDYSIPYGVVTIEKNAFAMCMNLNSVYIPATVTHIGDYAFDYCENLINFVFEEESNLQSIGAYSFASCERLSHIVLPEGLTTIPGDAFFSCGSLRSITLPSSIEEICWDAFRDCYNIIEVINYSNLEIVAGSTDNGGIAVNAKFVHSGDSVIVDNDGFIFTTISGINYLLGYNGVTDTLILPESYNGETYELYKNAFEGRQEISKIIISDGVTAIGERAFGGCHHITSVTLGQNLTLIDKDAFAWCYKITEVINKSSLEITVGSEAHGKVAYYAFEVHTEESKISSVNGYLFYTFNGIHYVVDYVGDTGVTSITLPERYNGEMYQIRDYAFAIENIKKVTISSGVTAIGDDAFNTCYGLESIIIGENVEHIGEAAFAHCSRLISISIPQNVTSIGKLFFADNGWLSQKIIFEDSEGWSCSLNADGSDAMDLPSEVFSDPIATLNYLTGKYVYHYLWKK